MRIYISGAFTSQGRLRPMADRLRTFGHEILSTWLYEAVQPSTLNTEEWNLALANKDIAEVFAADCIVLDLDGESTTGGRFTEWGVACYPGSLRRRYIVGGSYKSGVFLTQAHRRFDSWDDLLAYFQVKYRK